MKQLTEKVGVGEREYKDMQKILVLIFVFIVWLDGANAFAEITPAQVEASIRRGVSYLQKNQKGNGGWDEYVRADGGLTALCTLAQLNSGVPVNDPSVRKALEYLRRKEPRDTYSVSLQTLVFCQVGAGEDIPRIQRNVRWLEKQQILAGIPGAFAGAWSYGEVGVSEIAVGGDPSNTQFALLALSAAEERGIAVAKSAFERSLAYWSGIQTKAGSWAYSQGMSASGSMTCAGIASMIICKGHLQSGSSRVEGDNIVCCGAEAADDRIQRGLDWLAQSFTVQGNPGSKFYIFYYLYALERVGRLSGQRLIGNHDWYREGAQFLLNNQDDFAGFWAGPLTEDNRNVATSFALLFLAKGKRQVVLGRLQHGQGNDWSKHSEGPRQLVRHLEKDWGRDLAWQTVQLSGATVAELLQTPVLMIAGQEPLSFTPDEKKLLKDYVEQNGFILFEATAGDGCGDPKPFERSVQALCNELFDGPLERLPPTHPIWYAERKVDAAALGEGFWVYGVQTCCRTGVAYVPRSITCRWELSDPTGRTAFSPAVKQQLDASVALGQNIIAYSTGRELKDKLETRSVLETTRGVGANERGVVTIARLALDAGGEDARRAIPNLARYVARDIPLRIATESPRIPINAKQLEPYPICWLHGRRAFQFTDQEVAELRTYIEHGGSLLVDSICGDEGFATAVREQLTRVIPNGVMEPVSSKHPMLSAAYGGFDLSNVQLRIPDRGVNGTITIEKRSAVAQLEAIKIDSRIAVLFSPYDLSCALESQNSIQCPGYSTEDAAKIGINMLLFMLLQ